MLSLDPTDCLPFTRFLGIVTPTKPHKTAWLLNKALGIRLCRQPNASIDFVGGKSIEVLHYLFRTESSEYRLARNKLGALTSPIRLVPELGEFDYFLLIEGAGHVARTASAVGAEQSFQYVSVLQVAEVKNAENLMF